MYSTVNNTVDSMTGTDKLILELSNQIIDGVTTHKYIIDKINKNLEIASKGKTKKILFNDGYYGSHIFIFSEHFVNYLATKNIIPEETANCSKKDRMGLVPEIIAYGKHIFETADNDVSNLERVHGFELKKNKTDEEIYEIIGLRYASEENMSHLGIKTIPHYMPWHIHNDEDIVIGLDDDKN